MRGAAAAARQKKVADREPEMKANGEVSTLQATIEIALRDAEVVHTTMIVDIQKQKLTRACIEAMVEAERKNWHKFYASFVAQRISSSVVKAMSAAAATPGW